MERAEKALDLPLAHLLRDATAEELSRTREAQLSVLLASLMAWEALRDRIEAPIAFAGHSLGQITALIASGALTVADGIALAVARANLSGMGASVATRVRLSAGDWFAALPPNLAGQFDLIVANILAGPLSALAPAMGRIAARSAAIILSGILEHQAPRVIAAYARQSMVLRQKLLKNGWTTLILEKR